MKAIIEIEVEIESFATPQDVTENVKGALMLSNNFEDNVVSYTVKLKEQ